MELHEIKNGLIQAHLLLEKLDKTLSISKKTQEVEMLNEQVLQDNFWDDIVQARKLQDRLSELKKIVETFNQLSSMLEDLDDIYTMVKQGENEFFDILDEEFISFNQKLEEFDNMMLLSHDYDHLNAIVQIHPGAGGTESQDWAEMLYRMYTRYSNRQHFKIEVLDYLDGDEAGIKSVSFLVKGYNAYGLLKSEKGIHRLVRISPFDSNSRRHTSFASVDVMPEFNDTVDIKIKNEDLKIDTYRSSGAGGQHVNTTDSAVRITHIPTKIVVTCQNQRSQIKNREQALVMLKSKLYQLEIEKKQQKIKEMKGEQLDNGWGSQIRSYVFHPYNLVKDARTGYETSQVTQIMDGNIDEFIYAYLRWELSQ